MNREAIRPAGITPTPAFFVPAVKVGNTVYVSGQLARDAHDRIEGDMAVQARRCIENIRVILEAAGARLEHVVKINAYMTDMRLAPQAWAVREEYFAASPPASTGVQVVALTRPEALIEIEVVAVITD
jgi:2-iminobutanoate/2-iminopropanoate deaminase